MKGVWAAGGVVVDKRPLLECAIGMLSLRLVLPRLRMTAAACRS